MGGKLAAPRLMIRRESTMGTTHRLFGGQRRVAFGGRLPTVFFSVWPQLPE